MRRASFITTFLLLACETALAGPLLDYIRSYDLNDYAIGVAVAGAGNPYIGAENSSFAYPYPTALRDSALTNDWLLIRDGDVGLRWVSDDGEWELGLVGRIQTLSLGDSDAPELEGINDREWTLETGPMVGWRGWPVHINVKTYAEVTDRHEGSTSSLTLSLPIEFSRGYLVPSLEMNHQDSDYVHYYFGVNPASATPLRPAYAGESATNFAVKARWGYALNDKWLLSGAIGYEKLDSVIEDSPIVDDDSIWSARAGLAYNADLFRPRDYDFSAPESPRFQFRIGGFRDKARTKVVRDASSGIPGFEIDIEDILGASEDETVLQVESIIRLGNYHRLEFGYFELGRDSSTTLDRDVSLGDSFFPEGTQIDTEVDASIYMAGYSYSLIRDSQKELGIMAGIHFSDFDLILRSSTTDQIEQTSGNTPLPVIGVHAAVFIGNKTTIAGKAQIFRTDFNNFEGSLNYAALDVQYRFTKAMSAGIGYNYYGMQLSSEKSSVNGTFKVRHHGPTAYLSFGF